MQLDGPNQSIRSLGPSAGRRRGRKKKRERDRDRRGAEEKKFKASKVKLEGHSLSAFSQPA